MKHHQTAVGKSQDYITPKNILQPLGEFDLDPCVSLLQPWKTANHSMNITINGLKMPWFGRVWLNPPFDRYERPSWMKRMCEHNNGIMLIPAACETNAFRDYVAGTATGILMLNHRPHFHLPDGSRAPYNCGCTICLVSYGETNAKILKNSGLGTFLVEDPA